ncbi:SGF29 tudor-like domain-containing protein [Powellomyces hirtus]|nr:SGF29 tudor-like domain-containing protein [Powellomyces hirtus]
MADNRMRKSRSSSADPSSNEELNLWSQLCDELWRFTQHFSEAEAHHGKVNHINERILRREREGKDFPDSGARKVLKLYEDCRETVEAQKKVLHSALDKVGILVALRDATENGTEKPERRKKRKLDEKPRTSSVPTKKVKGKEDGLNAVLSVSLQVIARCKVDNQEGYDWILGSVERWVPEKGKYLFRDAEEDDPNPGIPTQIKELVYYLPKDIVPLLTEQEVARRPVFQKEHKVLALYPGTTCFYRAKVKTPPHKGSLDYILLFEDDDGKDRPVIATMVLDRAAVVAKPKRGGHHADTDSDTQT